MLVYDSDDSEKEIPKEVDDNKRKRSLRNASATKQLKKAKGEDPAGQGTKEKAKKKTEVKKIKRQQAESGRLTFMDIRGDWTIIEHYLECSCSVS